MEASADSMSGDSLLPDSQMAAFLLSSYSGRGEGAFLAVLHKDTNLTHEGSTLMT